MSSAPINGTARWLIRTSVRHRPRISPKRSRRPIAYEAPYQAAQSAAAVHVFADAFKRAQSLDPEKVRDAIAATELETFYGPVKFDEPGRNIAKPMVLTQVQGGKYVVVFPANRPPARRSSRARCPSAAANYRLSPA